MLSCKNVQRAKKPPKQPHQLISGGSLRLLQSSSKFHRLSISAYLLYLYRQMISAYHKLYLGNWKLTNFVTNRHHFHLSFSNISKNGNLTESCNDIKMVLFAKLGNFICPPFLNGKCKILRKMLRFWNRNIFFTSLTSPNLRWFVASCLSFESLISTNLYYQTSKSTQPNKPVHL